MYIKNSNLSQLRFCLGIFSLIELIILIIICVIPDAVNNDYFILLTVYNSVFIVMTIYFELVIILVRRIIN